MILTMNFTTNIKINVVTEKNVLYNNNVADCTDVDVKLVLVFCTSVNAIL